MKKPLTETLKRFNEILKYDVSGISLIRESEEDIITTLSDKIKTYTPLKKGGGKFVGTSLLQAILIDSGFCVNKKKCDKIDGDFGTTTQTALNNFIGKNNLVKDDVEILKTKMVEKSKEGKSYSTTEDKMDVAVEVRRDELKNVGVGEKYLKDDNILKDKYLDYWRHDKRLDISGEDIEKDMLSYISKKEGGITDDPRDTNPAKYPCPHEYNTDTHILMYKGEHFKPMKVKLIGEGLPEPTKSKIYKDSYASNKWHTNRGIVWKTWKSIRQAQGIQDEYKNVINWFNMTDKNVWDVYYYGFFKPQIIDKGNETSSDLLNHFLAVVAWGSGGGGFQKLLTIVNDLFKELGYDNIDDAIEGLGLSLVFDHIINKRAEQFLSYKNADVYGGGWVNSALNFHKYFANKYIKPVITTVDSEKANLEKG